MEQAATEALEGGPGREHGVIAENAVGYLTLLREHIEKEDGVLYPLAERLIPERGARRHHLPLHFGGGGERRQGSRRSMHRP